jgi:hypothetical protein
MLFVHFIAFRLSLLSASVRPYVALILYRVSTLSDFAKGMVLSRSTGQCYLQFLEEIPSSWEYLYKTSDLEHSFYYLCMLAYSCLFFSDSQAMRALWITS